MKNYWLKIREKKNQLWTAEFSRNGIFVLKPRRIELLSTRSAMTTTGNVTVTFKDAMISSNDQELNNFLSESRLSTQGWIARLRLYSNFINELEQYEMSMIRYVSIDAGKKSLQDICFTFHFLAVKHTFCT